MSALPRLAAALAAIAAASCFVDVPPLEPKGSGPVSAGGAGNEGGSGGGNGGNGGNGGSGGNGGIPIGDCDPLCPEGTRCAGDTCIIEAPTSTCQGIDASKGGTFLADGTSCGGITLSPCGPASNVSLLFRLGSNSGAQYRVHTPNPYVYLANLNAGCANTKDCYAPQSDGLTIMLDGGQLVAAIVPANQCVLPVKIKITRL